MAKNIIVNLYCLLLCVCYCSCVSGDKVTDTTEETTATEVMPVFFDTEAIRTSIIKKLHKSPDTIKTIIVVSRSFEEQCLAVRKTYISQIGIRELTGHNDGPEIDKYLAIFGLKGSKLPYCASGVGWTFYVNSIKTKINPAAASTLNRNNLVWYKHEFLKMPHFGDVVSFWIPSLGGIHHCGFLDGDRGNGNYNTVEFNTSVSNGIFREGGGVDRKIRSWNATYACSRWIKEN